MPQDITITVYKFDELSDKAKARARDWFREGYPDHDWWDASYEDFSRIADILGIEFDQYPVQTVGGKTRYETAIHFSGFSSQGDGACFAGRYTYKAKAHRKIRAYARKDEKLHAIADGLLALQRANGYRLEARVKHRGSYSHEYCTEIDVTDKRTGELVEVAIHEELVTLLRDFMRWIYRQLESEYEYLTSDEQVDETIVANEYTFTASGKREG